MADKESVGEKPTGGSKDIGGWLLFFVIIFIISAASSLLSLSTVFSKVETFASSFDAMADFGMNMSNIEIVPPSSFLLGFQFFLLLASLIVLVVALVFIFKRKKEGIMWIIISMWTSYVVSIVVNMTDMTWMAPVYEEFGKALPRASSLFSGIAGLNISGIIFSAVFPGLLTWYFLSSKRVKETLVN